MIIPIGLLDGLLVLAGGVACFWLACFQAARRARACLLAILIWMWWSALGAMLVDCGDWVHLFWGAQVPLMGVFALSGALLFTVWPEDAAFREERAQVELERLVAARGHPAWWFLAIVTSLGLVPLFLLEILVPPDGRNIGEPLRRVLELGQWGFGGALPECLEPITTEGRARGVGFLPREVTVPAGSMLLAAYYWIAFCALALLGRAITDPRARRAFLLVSPLLVAAILFLNSRIATQPLAWFDLQLFVDHSPSGVWQSDPAVLKSFGPTLLVALVAAILLAVVLRLDRRPVRG